MRLSLEQSYASLQTAESKYGPEAERMARLHSIDADKSNKCYDNKRQSDRRPKKTQSPIKKSAWGPREGARTGGKRRRTATGMLHRVCGHPVQTRT